MRLKHLDILRGVAAVMVALFHLEKSTLIPQTTNYFEYGYTGVQIFFVISGFILPYSLYKSHYQIKHFGTFLIKRIVRIHPAYIAAILCGVILTIITGRELSSVGGLFSQVLFVNSLFDQPFSSAVFWTLAIEFQFYILISLLYPLLLSNSRSFLIVVLLSAVSVFVQSGAHIFKWMPFFGAGILIFNFRCTKMPGTAFCAATIALITFICLNSEVAQCTAATFAILFILFAVSNLFSARQQYNSSISTPTYLRPSFLATTDVVPEPKNGSKTMSFGFELAKITFATNFSGF